MKRIFNRIKRSRGSLGLEKTDLYRFECFNVLDKKYNTLVNLMSIHPVRARQETMDGTASLCLIKW
jgi:hypothetical protein